MILINIKGEGFLSLFPFISKSVSERRGQKWNGKDIYAPKGTHPDLVPIWVPSGDLKDCDE